jgi:hypothetical protein
VTSDDRDQSQPDNGKAELDEAGVRRAGSEAEHERRWVAVPPVLTEREDGEEERKRQPVDLVATFGDEQPKKAECGRERSSAGQRDYVRAAEETPACKREYDCEDPPRDEQQSE